MQENLSMVPQDGSVDSFVDFMSRVQNPGGYERLMPLKIRLDGTIGMYTQRKFDPATRKIDISTFGNDAGKEWYGTILLVCWFAKWKYSPNDTSIVIRTREFQSFTDETIHLMKMNYDKKEEEGRTEEIGTYDSYRAFKEAKAHKDADTDKVTYPYDLWASIYVYVPELKQIVNYQFKGDTRSDFFDYMNAYNVVDGDERKARAFVEIKTKFGSVQREMPKSKSNPEGKFYYAGTFQSVGFNTPDEITMIRSAFLSLVEWMKSFKKENEVVEEIKPEDEPALDKGMGDEIRLEDIPF